MWCWCECIQRYKTKHCLQDSWINLLLPQFQNSHTTIFSWKLNIRTFWAPGGSNPYLQQWLNQQSDKEIVSPAGLVKSVFDNNQKVGKIWCVITGDNVVPAIVITSHLNVTFDPESSLQNNESLNSENWMDVETTGRTW